MGLVVKNAVLAALMMLFHAQAEAALAPEPVITAAPILPRDEARTLGWYSNSAVAGTTFYTPWVYDDGQITYTSSGNYFRRCSISSTCTMYTSCSSGYMVAASGVSSFCGLGATTGAGNANFCSYHILQPSLGANTRQSWYWCDKAPLTGYTFFAQQPSQPTVAVVSSLVILSSFRASPSAGAATATTSSNRSNSPTSSASNSSQMSAAAEKKSSAPTGAIVGGVMGGLAVLGAIAFGIIFFMRRNNKKKQTQAAYQTAYQTASLMGAGTPDMQQPAYHPNAPYPPPGDPHVMPGYHNNESKPYVQPHYQQPQQGYPQTLHDPHAVGSYPGSPNLSLNGAHEMIAPVPVPGGPTAFAPQELPVSYPGHK